MQQAFECDLTASDNLKDTADQQQHSNAPDFIHAGTSLHSDARQVGDDVTQLLIA
jgi:hypothetical protein